MKRLHSPRRHRLTFDIPAPIEGVNVLEFDTHEESMGVEVGYEVEDRRLREMKLAKSPRHTKNLERFVRKFCRKTDVAREVRRILKWVYKLDLNLSKLYIQFVPEDILGGGFGASGIAGNRRRALLRLEFIPDPRGIAYVVNEGCEDIIPHELMHVKDVLDGRSPTIYPATLPGQGDWLDLIRHLWIDGYLDRMGLPHFPKSARLSLVAESLKEIGKRLSAAELSMLGETWWGKPMTLRNAIQVGLDLGFPLKKGCPMEKWFAAQSG